MARRRSRTFRGQILVSTLLLTSIFAAAMILGVQIVLARTAERDLENVLIERMAAVQAVVDARAATSAPGRDVGQYLDPGARLYDGDGALLSGSIETDAQDSADDLAERLSSADRVGTTTTGRAHDLRLLAEVVGSPSGWRGIAVVSQATGPYERSERYALVATVVAGVALVAASVLVARRSTEQALRPVTRMATLATDWSEHDLSRRFDLADGPGSTDELTRLGASLDGLLDRVADALRAEQRLTSELAHELRTPLTAVLGIAELGEVRGSEDPRAVRDYAAIAASARTMSETITTLLDVARRHARAQHGLADAEASASVEEILQALAPPTPLVRTVVEDPSVQVAVPTALAVRCLSPVLENAVRHARGRVEIAVADDGDAVRFVVSDDGEGVPADLVPRLFEAGVSGSGGTGLGLAVADRVASAVGGSVTLLDPGTSSFAVRLPRA